MLRWIFALLWIVIAQPARSGGDFGDWQISGFGTIAGAFSDDDSIALTRGALNKPGGGRIDLGPDSIIGFQLNIPVATRADFTLQIRAGEDDKGHVEPTVGWAFLRQTWTPSLSTRIGRMRVPFFMLSDSLQVNYSNPWVRPPPEVYGLNPFNDLDGVDLLYHLDIAGADVEVRPYIGRGRVEFAENGSAQISNTKGLNLSVYIGHLSLHAGHGESRFALQWGDAQFKQLDAALRFFGYENVSRQLAGRDGYIRFDTLGFQWDDGKWLVSGEYMKRRASRYIASNHAWFASLGYRVGDWTPYVTVARQFLDAPMTETVIAVPGLAEGVRAFNVSRNDAQHSTAIGVRWDFARSMALKGEYSRNRIEKDAWGTFFPTSFADPFALGGKTVHLYTLSLDWVF
ncbi:MAG: hypothetical protein JNJ44_04340 [Zoogloeaceae bacterium]|nr:hypothetical protein [Zoogloeaceae bacterium]